MPADSVNFRTDSHCEAMYIVISYKQGRCSQEITSFNPTIRETDPTEMAGVPESIIPSPPAPRTFVVLSFCNSKVFKSSNLFLNYRLQVVCFGLVIAYVVLSIWSHCPRRLAPLCVVLRSFDVVFPRIRTYRSEVRTTKQSFLST